MFDLALVVEFEDVAVGNALAGSTDLVGSTSRRPEPRLVAHPNAATEAKTILPSREPLEPFLRSEHVHQRETDGMEPLIRLAALWQRMLEAPPRRSRQGAIYKRDRDRFEDDPALAGPIADALEPLPDMAMLWLSLAGDVGLITPEPESDRIIAAPAEFWIENAVHLPQMIAARWLSLWTWHESHGFQEEPRTGIAPPLLATPFLRTVALSWLASLEPADSIALDDSGRRLRPPQTRLGSDRVDRHRVDRESLGYRRVERGLARRGISVRTRLRRRGTRRRAVAHPNHRDGAHVLRLGPPPSPREGFEKFLYVQPNYEVIAYRQGLTRARSAAWRDSRGSRRRRRLGIEADAGVGLSRIGRRLERRRSDGVSRHGSKALSISVVDAIRTWSERRERLTYHANATLIEFAAAEDLEQALLAWEESTPEDQKPTKINDRMLLAADERSIPFGRFRQIRARDYRRDPEVCVTVEEDGVTLLLDPERTDLFIDAELGRFAEELPPEKADAARRCRAGGFK